VYILSNFKVASNFSSSNGGKPQWQRVDKFPEARAASGLVLWTSSCALLCRTVCGS